MLAWWDSISTARSRSQQQWHKEYKNNNGAGQGDAGEWMTNRSNFSSTSYTKGKRKVFITQRHLHAHPLGKLREKWHACGSPKATTLPAPPPPPTHTHSLSLTHTHISLSICLSDTYTHLFLSLPLSLFLSHTSLFYTHTHTHTHTHTPRKGDTHTEYSTWKDDTHVG